MRAIVWGSPGRGSGTCWHHARTIRHNESWEPLVCQKSLCWESWILGKESLKHFAILKYVLLAENKVTDNVATTQIWKSLAFCHISFRTECFHHTHSKRQSSFFCMRWSVLRCNTHCPSRGGTKEQLLLNGKDFSLKNLVLQSCWNWFNIWFNICPNACVKIWWNVPIGSFTRSSPLESKGWVFRNQNTDQNLSTTMQNIRLLLISLRLGGFYFL